MNSSLSLSRRALLAGFARLRLCALARRHPLLAQSGLQVRPHRIDVHHHLFPPEYRTAVASANAGALVPWTAEQSLAEMDKSAIQTAMLSISPPGIWFAGAAEGRKLARIINDYGAKMRQD